MSLNLNGNVTGIYLGSTKADAVYLGNVKVFEDAPPPPETGTVEIGAGNYKRTYNTIKLGDLWWTKEDLQWDPSSSASSYDWISGYSWTTSKPGVDHISSYYYYNKMGYRDSNPSKPTGWRKAEKSDWDKLITFLGGNTTDNIKKILSGTNIYSGFYFGMRGERFTNTGASSDARVNGKGSYGIWWAGSSYRAKITSSGVLTFESSSVTAYYGFGIRYVKTA